MATIMGSAIASIDATVVNLALPAIGRDFDVGLSSLQWTVTAYLVTLSALILLGGSLGDRFGRRRMFIVGVVWFAASSVLCGLAPGVGTLIAARALQGVGGALLTPASLAILKAAFHDDDAARAIGAWSAFSGVATATGPFVGGWLISAASWRWVFFVNVPVAVLTVVLAIRHIPESRSPVRSAHFDVAGAVLAVAGLGALTYGLTELRSPSNLLGWVVGLAGAAGLLGFVLLESRRTDPMLPLGLFRSRQFSAANAVTLLVYAALGVTFVLLSFYLQDGVGYSPLEAGLALGPLTVVTLALSEAGGALSARIGPRLPMTVGPLLIGLGTLLLVRVGPGRSYVGTTLPALLVLGLGLALTVAPLTSTVLGAVDGSRAGIASGVNNAAARTAQLIAIAVIPAAVGLGSDVTLPPTDLTSGFQAAMIVAAALAAAGGVLAWLTIVDPTLHRAMASFSCPIGTPGADAQPAAPIEQAVRRPSP